jgi:hypothetical protein
MNNQQPKDLSLDEMLDCFRNPASDKRSIAELDDVIDEIMERNPDFVEKISRIVDEQRKAK